MKYSTYIKVLIALFSIYTGFMLHPNYNTFSKQMLVKYGVIKKHEYKINFDTTSYYSDYNDSDFTYDEYDPEGQKNIYLYTETEGIYGNE